MLPTTLKVVSAADERIQQLADVMFELHVAGGCTEGLLLAEGFSRHELATYSEAARKLVNQRRLRRLEQETPEPSDEEVLAIAIDRCGGLVGQAAIVAALRTAKLKPSTIARLWDDITVKLAATVAKLPQPSAEEMRKAFA